MDYDDVIRHQKISHLFPEAETDVTPSEWWWAYSIFRSRNWKTPSGARISPILELFNYGQKPSIRVAINDDGTTDLIAEKAIETGQPIIINDGLISSRELLEWYGFVLPGENKRDYYPVGVGLQEDDKLYGAKRHLFKQRGIKDGQTFHLQRDLIPRDLVFALRVFHVSVYDYENADNALQDRVVSVQNEISVCNTLIDMCEETLDGLTHSLKRDKERLKSPDLSNNERAAIIFRRSEKRILLSVLKLAKMQFADVEKLWDSRSFEIPTVRERDH